MPMQMARELFAYGADGHRFCAFDVNGNDMPGAVAGTAVGIATLNAATERESFLDSLGVQGAHCCRNIITAGVT